MAVGDRPSELPEWASGPDADILAPSAGKKAIGYVFKEKPGRKVLNWFLNLSYLWFAFIITRFNSAGWLNLGSSTNQLERIDRTGAVDFNVNGSAASLLTSSIVRGRSELRVGQSAEESEGYIISAPFAGSGLDAEVMTVAPVDIAKRAGIQTGAFRAESVSGAPADFTDTAFPFAESLYRNNTAKLVLQLLIRDDNADGRYDTIEIAGSYNVNTAILNVGTPYTIAVTPLDNWGGQFVFCQVVPQPGGTLPKPIMASGTGVAAITAIAFDGTNWVDLFSAGLATTFGGPVRLNIFAF